VSAVELWILTGTLEPNNTPAWAPWSTSNPAPVNIINGTITAPATLTLQGAVSIVQHSDTITQTGGTIAATGTFQDALALNSARVGGYIQNTGTTAIEVYYGAHGSAVLANASLLENQGDAVDLTAGVPNGVYKGTVAVTGTTGGTFVAVEAT